MWLGLDIRTVGEMGELQNYPSESREAVKRTVVSALQNRVSLDSVNAFHAPGRDLDQASADLRERLQDMLVDGDEIWYFSTPFEGLSGMAGYAILRDGILRDFLLTVQS